MQGLHAGSNSVSYIVVGGGGGGWAPGGGGAGGGGAGAVDNGNPDSYTASPLAAASGFQFWLKHIL